MTHGAENGPHPCQWRPHYGEPCDCENRLAQVVTHTRTRTPLGPDFCAECSEAISEWVPWSVCVRARRVFSPAEPCRQCGPGYRIGDEGCRHTPPAEPLDG